MLFELGISNDGNRPGLFEYGISGLPVSWLSHQTGSRYLQAGETALDSFVVTVPASVATLADTGAYSVTFFATDGSIDTNSIQSVLYISPYCYIEDRIPINDANVTSTLVNLSFVTSGPAACSVFVGEVDTDSVEWQIFTTPSGYNHLVTIDTLLRDSEYVWTISALADWGYTTTSSEDTFAVINGVEFINDTLHLTVDRAYDQHFIVTAENIDSLAYNVQALVSDVPADAVIGFVGPGGPDDPYYSNGPEQFFIDLGVHTQDVTAGTYYFDLILESWREDTAISILPVVMTVLPSSLLIITELVAVDSQTMGHTYRIVNLADTITNLTLTAADSVFNDVYMVPQIEHMLLKTNDTIEFEVIPYLQLENPSAVGVQLNDRGFPARFSSDLLAEVAGDIEVRYDGELLRLTPDFTIPPSLEVFLGTVENIRYCVPVSGWYCTNKKDITVTLITPSGIDPAEVPEGTFSVTFTPRRPDVPPHKVVISFNSTPLDSLMWVVPTGSYLFNVPAEDINFASEGNAINYAHIRSEWQSSQGHYSVASDFELCLCLERYSQYVLAENQEQADEIVSNLPQLRHGVGNIEIAINTPAEASTLVKLAPVTISATITEDGGVPDGIVVWAEFSNGDTKVNLYDDGLHDDGLEGDGVFANVWEPYNVQNPFDITIVAGLCGSYVSSILSDCAVVYPKIQAVVPRHAEPHDDIPLETAYAEVLRGNSWLKVAGFTDPLGLLEMGEFTPSGDQVDLRVGDQMRVTFLVADSASKKWPPGFKDNHKVFRLTIDSDTIKADNSEAFATASLEELQRIPLLHTLMRYNLLIGIEWDTKSKDAFVSNLNKCMKKVNNFLYDVFDGQAIVDTVWYVDNYKRTGVFDLPDTQVKEAVDVRIDATNSHNSIYFTSDGHYDFPGDSGHVHTGRWYFAPSTECWLLDTYNYTTTGEGSREIPNWDLDWRPKQNYGIFEAYWSRMYRLITHELTHLFWELEDRYPPTIYCRDDLEQLGIMAGNVPYWSELNEADWVTLESKFEMTSDDYDNLPKGSAVYLVSSNPSSGWQPVNDRGARLSGPNNNNYGPTAQANSGSRLTIDSTSYMSNPWDGEPEYLLLHVRKCKTVFGIEYEVDAAKAEVKHWKPQLNSVWTENQKTDNDGYLMILGIHPGDSLKIKSGVTGTYEYEGGTFDEFLLKSCPDSWLFLTEISNVEFAKTRADANVSIQLIDMADCWPLSDSAVVYPQDGNPYPIPIEFSPDSTRLTLVLQMVDDTLSSFEIPFENAVGDTMDLMYSLYLSAIDTTTNLTVVNSPEGISIVLDSSHGSAGTIALLVGMGANSSPQSGRYLVDHAFALDFGQMTIPLAGTNIVRVEYPDVDYIETYESRLSIAYYDTSANAWLDLPTFAQDTVLNYVETNIDQPGIYALFAPTSCCDGNRGDLNNDGTDTNILDLTFLVDRIFRGGPSSECEVEADINNDGAPANILDLTYLVDFIFRGGPPSGPC